MTERLIQRNRNGVVGGGPSDIVTATTEKAKQARSRHTGKLNEIVTGFGRYVEGQRATRAKIVDPAMRQRLGD